MIYLSPMVRSGYGEETFWVWFERNFNSSYDLPESYNKDDVVLRYSTVGPVDTKPGKNVALCWELLPEMRKVLKESTWDGTIDLTYQTAAKADRIAVASRFSAEYYRHLGKKIDLLPIGVDTELFRPRTEEEKYNLKLKYNIPHNKKVGFWCGTPHKMKGSESLQKYANENKDVFWITVWYQSVGNFNGEHKRFFTVDQQTLSELMGCSDFHLCTSILRPYYIVEYESMSCNLRHIRTSSIEKDFEVGDNPREAIFENGWDRHSCKSRWQCYIEEISNE